ncbi:MAG: hypothetical protein ACJ8CR_18615 [Roseiflexaceae bacterium]
MIIIDHTTLIDRAGRINANNCFALDECDDAVNAVEAIDNDDIVVSAVPPIGTISARINPKVGWAKQVRPTIDAGSIYSTIASLAACRGVDSTCFAPTTDDRNDSVDARNANDAGKHND